MIQILHRYTGAVLFTSPTATTTAQAVREAITAGANLSRANLSDANTEAIREDFYSILAITPGEAPGLLVSLRLGKVDGSTYTGECAGLVGTIGNVRGCSYDAILGLPPNGSRLTERWFLGIRAGDTPATNAVARLTEGWIVDWVKEHAPKAADTIAADDAFVSALAAIQAKRLEAASENDAAALVTLLPL